MLSKKLQARIKMQEKSLYFYYCFSSACASFSVRAYFIEKNFAVATAMWVLYAAIFACPEREITWGVHEPRLTSWLDIDRHVVSREATSALSCTWRGAENTGCHD